MVVEVMVVVVVMMVVVVVVMVVVVVVWRGSGRVPRDLRLTRHVYA